VLFQLIGTRYGGDGEQWFALPDLRGRMPMHMRSTSDAIQPGAVGGVEEVTLTVNQLPAHNHALLGSVDVASTNAPAGNVPASLTPAGTQRAYRSVPLDQVALAPTALAPVGGSQPHENMHPYLVIQIVISLYGEFPSPT
jgi:microcystin-dependent protein